MYLGGWQQKSVQWFTFPCFGSTQLQVVPCPIVGVEIGSWNPTLLLCSADKPPTCQKTTEAEKQQVLQQIFVSQQASRCIKYQNSVDERH